MGTHIPSIIDNPILTLTYNKGCPITKESPPKR